MVKGKYSLQNPYFQCARDTFSSPEAEIVLVITKNRGLWSEPIFFLHAQSTCFAFSANQIYQIEKDSVNRRLSVLEATRGSQSLVLTRRIAVRTEGPHNFTRNYAQ